MTAAKIKERQKERAIEFYRVNYAIPFFEALRDCKPSADVERLNLRCRDFRWGIHMANPHSRLLRKFDEVDNELYTLMRIGDSKNS